MLLLPSENSIPLSVSCSKRGLYEVTLQFCRRGGFYYTGPNPVTAIPADVFQVWRLKIKSANGDDRLIIGRHLKVMWCSYQVIFWANLSFKLWSGWHVSLWQCVYIVIVWRRWWSRLNDLSVGTSMPPYVNSYWHTSHYDATENRHFYSKFVSHTYYLA